MVDKAWRNRIVESGQEAPDQLLVNPFNARIHPKPQQDALSGVLNSIGWIAPVIVNKRSGHVVDGHLRVSLALSKGEKSIPVDYVDLDENEEKIMLASLDYIGSMAVYDREAVDTLLQQVNSDDSDVQVLLDKLGVAQGLTPPNNPYDEWEGMPAFDLEDIRAKYSLVVHFETEEAIEAFAQAVGQTVTTKTKSIQYPKSEAHFGNNRVVNDE
jgi:hypothetical protein